MKGKFDAYVLWPLAKKFQNLIVDRSTARDFSVSRKNTDTDEKNNTEVSVFQYVSEIRSIRVSIWK